MHTDSLDGDTAPKHRRHGITAAAVVLALTLVVGFVIVTQLYPSGRTLTITKPANGTLVGDGINCGTAGSDCSVNLSEGEQVILEARADGGYVFASFTGDCAPMGRTVMNAARTCGAAFEPAPPVAPTSPLTIVPPIGGTIVGANITCGTLGSKCAANYPDGTAIRLEAFADRGFDFLRFTGHCAPDGRLLMTEARTCSANFLPEGRGGQVKPPGGNVGGAKPPPAPNNHAIVRVFYATDRARTSATTVEYGAARNAGGDLQLGRFDVSVPRDHRMGSVERPTVLTFWREDPSRHFIIVQRTSQTEGEFFEQVSTRVAQSRRKSAFVFVHGYNVAFDDAIYRTAQLAYDLAFDGAPILYSWPSVGTEIGYAVDANNSQWSIPHLRRFLEDVSNRSGAQVVHLIAHSMGNQPLVHALREIAITPRPDARPRFNQLVLTAPDIDVDTFRQLAGALKGSAERITLYASSNDVALKLSKRYQGYQRAGDSVPTVVVLPGIDTIDVSALETSLLGHSYYGDNKSVLADLFRLITDGRAPDDRFGLREAGSPSERWWVFRP
jgi:esterase/lipase superfamily enzyme